MGIKERYIQRVRGENSVPLGERGGTLPKLTFLGVSRHLVGMRAPSSLGLRVGG